MSILGDLFGAGTWGTGGNLVAAFLLGVPGAGLAWWKREHLGRALSAFLGRWHPHKDDLAAIKAAAEAARRIAADTYEHHTGLRHPDSPEYAHRKDGSP